MNLHTLPWPEKELQSHGETRVEMRVTLSYFVDPNRARLGWKKRHRYASHGLRFAVRKPAESSREFRARVNGAARTEEEDPQTGDPKGWYVGSDLRGKGSLHHDRWFGTAAELAEREQLAVYPIIGWWREKLSFGKAESKARYALVVTIRTPTTSVDIYQPVAAKIPVPITTEI